MMEGERQQNDITCYDEKEREKNICQSNVLYPAKISFKHENK